MKTLEDLFGTDEALEREGVWVDFGAAGKFLIASAGPGNPRFQKVAERVLRPVRRAIEQNALTNEVAQKLSSKIYAEAIILGWEGVTFRGETLAFSKENAETLLNALPRLLVALQRYAEDVALFQSERQEADAKN
jgi:hypothetical protein